MVNDDLAERLDDLEEKWGVDAANGVNIIHPHYELEVDEENFPDGISCDDIRTPSVEELDDEDVDLTKINGGIVPPLHKPRSLSTGINILTPTKMAHLWDRLPEELYERELELRLEQGEPIPPILQQ